MNTRYKLMRKLTEWYKGIDKKTMIVTIAVTVIFIAVWVLFFMNISNVADTYRRFMEENITYQSDKASSDISSLVGDNINSTVNLATAMSRFEKGDDNLKGMLDSAINRLNCENAVIIDNDGEVFFNDGTYSTDYDLSSIYNEINPTNKYSFIDNESNFLTDEDSFICAVPMRNASGEAERYLLTITAYNTVFVQSNIRDNVDHDELLLNNHGRIVERIFPDGFVKANGTHYFFDYVEQAISEDDFSSFSASYNECLNSGTPGSFSAKSGKQTVLYCYHPIDGTNGWAIIHCYTEVMVSEMIRDVTTKLIITFAIIIILMIVAATLLARHLLNERKKMRSLEFFDSLTGIYNRKAFIQRVKKLLKENNSLPYYIVCFDVVNFKMINETYGHERSDKIITSMADACKIAFGKNEAYARLTADIFVALSVDDGEGDDRTAFVEKYCNERAREAYINNQLKGKRGIYVITDFDEPIDQMIDKANLARKFVDTKSSSLKCFYTDDLLQDARKTQVIESQMSQALKNGEFKPYLQAKYNMQKNVVSGAEALVRWIKADGTVVPPGDFIPLFEQNGFVEKIDFYILEEICKYIRRMLDENRDVYTISVNQSRYLMNDPEYVNKVKEILLRYQIPVGLIELELTETVFFYERDRMIKMMSDLKAINVNLSIDDFGSGYSSFNILKDVPFSVLKIDREFLTDSVHTEKGKWILKEIVEMAHGLGMSVICEGVETREQADLLLSLDCHYAQGFYYARPIPIEDFIEKYNHVKEAN